MTTVLVDIKETDLLNFTSISQLKLESYSKEGHKKFFEMYPFTAYKNRMMGNNFITVQIPIENYLLFRGFNLIK